MVNYKFNQNVAKKFMDLPINGDETSLTYVWIDGSGQWLRSKTKTVNVSEVNQPSTWEFCAAGVGLHEFRRAKEAEEAEKAREKRAEKIDEFKGSKEEDGFGKAYEAEKSKKSKVHSSCELRPISIYNDPFLGGNAKLVLCDVYYQDKPVETNHRKRCLEILNEKINSVSKDYYFDPLFGIEQEYTLIDPKTDRPLGWPESGFPAPQGPYYLGVGTGSAIGRDIVEAHYRACQYANIPIYGYNAEVMPGQWEFQVGECKGIKMGDDLWMARYILIRLTEEFGVKVSFDPKPVEGDWNGTGAHINFSTNATRGENGIFIIHKMIKELGKHHNEAIKVYDPNGGKDNARRLSGKHETSKIDEFTWGFDDRFASIRISRSVEKAKKGYFEDRRPASNADPYKVMTHLLEICCNN